jgi:hypothetical protein
MGFIGGLLGTAGGVNGTGIAGPSSANIQTPVTGDQATAAINQSQNALQQQQAFANAVGAQNGLANQSSVYGQLQGVANGTGPNPAAAQLAQATGANTANQAALMAGQRGAGANVGLMARQAGQQGAANQQNAAGQAATMQANQSLNAMNQMGGLATSQANQQANAITGLNQAAQGQQGALLGAVNQQNQANIGMQSNINSANAGLANTSMQGQQALLGGAMSGLGSASSMMGGSSGGGGGAAGMAAMMAGGGLMMADGGMADVGTPTQPMDTHAGLAFLTSTKAPDTSIAPMPADAGAAALYSGMSGMSGGSSKAPPAKSEPGTAGDNSVNAYTSGQQDTTNPLDMGPQMPTAFNSSGSGMAAPMGIAQAMGGMPLKPMPPGKPKDMKSGGHVPGKPKVGGAKNTLKNDTVPAVLSPGEVVIPRSVMMGGNPAGDAAKFVQAIMAKKGGLPSQGARK